MFLMLAGTTGAFRAAALFVAAALLNLSVAATNGAGATRRAGEVAYAAGLTLDGERATAGQTFFSGASFSTAANSASLLSLDNHGRVGLSEETALRLDFDAGALGGALERGALRVYAPRGVAADFTTADARVTSDASGDASFSLDARGGYTVVSVQSGALEVSAGGAARLLKAGESYTTAPEPDPRRPPSTRRRVGLILALSAAVAVVAVIVTRIDSAPGSGCTGTIIVVSGSAEPTLPCF